MDDFYIAATSPALDERTRVLKHGETFAVFDRFGDVRPEGLGEEGLFHEGTRFLSRFVLTLGKFRPLLLSSTIREDNAALTVNLTNPDFYREGELVLPRGTLNISRNKFLWRGCCYERIRIVNFAETGYTVRLAVDFDADFVDIFEVRGTRRDKRGETLAPQVGKDSVMLCYRGLDGLLRRARVACQPAPDEIGPKRFVLKAELGPKGETFFVVSLACEIETSPLADGVSFERARTRHEEELRLARSRDCVIESSSEEFDDWIRRSFADLHMMLTDTSNGPFPYAGVPWYSTAFGRDSIITALSFLWVNPLLAKAVLGFLASMQGNSTDPKRDVEPGKILHEMRKGEMAALGEIPFGRYYGSVDSTPLFVILAGAYLQWTADIDFVRSIWPNIKAALRWIDDHGDLDKDGFVEYKRRSENGLINQGWRDSSDAVFHQNGALALGPIALCEVQAYVFAAKLRASDIADALGEPEQARALKRQASELRKRFSESFWLEDIGTFALALDGQKRPCRVRASSAGQCLFGGIASADQAKRVAHMLMSPQAYSGWGIRTVLDAEALYNPMSYHNGSVWPHDNAMIALGLSYYGIKTPIVRLIAGFLDATHYLELQRLPELFCGFHRRAQEGPTLYPVACSPQAWSSASVFMLLQAALGLSVDAANNQLTFLHPDLPERVGEVRIRKLRVGESVVDVSIHRYADDVGVNVLRREGPAHVTVVK